MYSLAFPNMFDNTTKIALTSDHDAVYSDLRLLLLSNRGSLFGDPEYGSRLQKVIYSNNNSILKDLVIDEIYTCIKVYMPQIKCERRDIDVKSDGIKLYCTINCYNLTTHINNLYEIPLTGKEQE